VNECKPLDVGAVDYIGKAEWKGHDMWKGKTADEARAIYVKLFKQARADLATNFYT
jgi:acyl-CoA-binding protein